MSLYEPDPAPPLDDAYPWDEPDEEAPPDSLDAHALDLADAADRAHDEEQLEPDPAMIEDCPEGSDPWDRIF